MKRFSAFIIISLLLISSLQFVSLERSQLNNSSNMSTMWTSEINQSSIHNPIITVSNQPKMVILAENQPSYVGTTSHLISNFINHDRQIQITYKQNNYSLKLFETQLHSLEIDSSHYTGWVEDDPFSTVSFSYSESANIFSLFIMNEDGSFILLEKINEDLSEILGMDFIDERVIIYDDIDLYTSYEDYQRVKTESINNNYLQYIQQGQESSLNIFQHSLIRVKLILDSSTENKKEEIISRFQDVNSIYESQLRSTIVIDSILTLSDEQVQALDDSGCSSNLGDKLMENSNTGSTIWNHWERNESFEIIVYYTSHEHMEFDNNNLGCSYGIDEGRPLLDEPIYININYGENCKTNPCATMLLAHEIGHSITLDHDRDPYCIGIFGWVIYGTIMCEDNPDFPQLKFSSNTIMSAHELNENNNLRGLAWTRLSVRFEDGISLIDNNGMRLNFFIVDIDNDYISLPLSCSVLYRTQFEIERYSGSSNLEIIEFFIGIRSSYLRGEPGEWDYWQTYDRFDPPRTFSVGDKHLMTNGWVASRESDSAENLINAECPESNQDAYQYLHVFQPNNQNDLQYSLFHSWRLWPVYNSGTGFDLPNAEYINFGAAEITFFALT